MATLRVFLDKRISDLDSSITPKQAGGWPDKHSEERSLNFNIGGRTFVVHPDGSGLSSYADLAGEVEDLYELAQLLMRHPDIQKSGARVVRASLRAKFYCRAERPAGEYWFPGLPNLYACLECNPEDAQKKYAVREYQAILEEEELNTHRVRIVGPCYNCCIFFYHEVRQGRLHRIPDTFPWDAEAHVF